MRIDRKSVWTFLLGLVIGFCIIFLSFAYMNKGKGRGLYCPKNYYDLTFKPVPQNERVPNSVFIGRKNSKPFLEINKSDDKYFLSILDSDANKVITHDYDKNGLISIAGKNWKFTPDQDDIVMKGR